jgi:hyperosmotically inducible protein
MYKHYSSIFSLVLISLAITVTGCNKSPPAAAPTPVASVPAGNVSDIDITEHVKTALQLNESLKGFDITVVTLKGDVRLIGVLNSQVQIDEAIKIARASDGAHSIHNELSIKK